MCVWMWILYSFEAGERSRCMHSFNYILQARTSISITFNMNFHFHFVRSRAACALPLHTRWHFRFDVSTFILCCVFVCFIRLCSSRLAAAVVSFCLFRFAIFVVIRSSFDWVVGFPFQLLACAPPFVSLPLAHAHIPFVFISSNICIFFLALDCLALVSHIVART